MKRLFLLCFMLGINFEVGAACFDGANAPHYPWMDLPMGTQLPTATPASPLPGNLGSGYTLLPPCPSKQTNVELTPDGVGLDYGQTVDFSDSAYIPPEKLQFGGMIWIRLQGEYVLIPYYRVK